MSLNEEKMSLFGVAFLSLSLTLGVVQTELVVDSSYVAAVYEHNLILNPEPHVPLSRPAALLHLQKNLDIYEEQAVRAAQQVFTHQETVINVLMYCDVLLNVFIWVK